MKTHPIRFLPLIAAALFTSGHADAALLDYEGFNGYTSSVTLGSGANAHPNATNPATSGTAAFATGNFAQFVSVADVATIDELRYGTTLADVLPIPEPGVCLISALGFCLFLRRKRRPRED